MCGVRRDILYQVQEGDGTPISAAMPISEQFTAVSNSCTDLPNTPTPSSGTTDSTGTFPSVDRLAMKSGLCLPADGNGIPQGSCTLVVQQRWLANGYSSAYKKSPMLANLSRWSHCSEASMNCLLTMRKSVLFVVVVIASGSAQGATISTFRFRISSVLETYLKYCGSLLRNTVCQSSPSLFTPCPKRLSLKPGRTALSPFLQESSHKFLGIRTGLQAGILSTSMKKGSSIERTTC